MFNFDMGNSFHYDQRGSIRKDGGPGSGNWGHAGRPGKVGGSGKGSGDSPGGAKHNKTDDEIISLKNKMENMKPMRQGAILNHTGIASSDELVSAAKSGDISKYTDMYIADRKRAAQPKNLQNNEQDKVSAMNIDEKKKWVEDALAQPAKVGVRDCQMQKIIDKMEMYETPQILCKEDFDDYVSQNNGVVIFRTVKKSDSLSAEQIAYETMYNNGKNFMGEGWKGDGLYFSVDKVDSKGYGDITMKTVIRKDAKIFDYDKQKREAKYLGVNDDIAAWAVCNGYQGMKTKDSVTGYDHYIMFNKAALIMCDELE